MRKNRTWRVALAALLTLLLLAAWTPQASFAVSLPSGVDESELGAELDAFLADHGDNRAAVGTVVFRGGEDLVKRCFGCIDAAGTQPLDEDCVLEWGSTTKLTVWVSAVQLAAEGKLDLEEDIRAYLPEGFLKNLRYDAPITMLNLMNHNAGFQETDFVLEVLREEDVIPLETYLAKYQPRQVFAPGEVSAYSNWGAALAGYIVECVSGMPFSQYVQEHIFAPLGMTHSAIAPDQSDNPWVKERRMAFVSWLPDGSPADEETKTYILPYPAGAAVSTLEDFAAFGKALLTRDPRLLSAEGFRLLYSPSLLYTGTDKPRMAHGFLVDYDFAVPIVGHDGNTAGGSSRLLLDLENNVGMVVLTNQLGGSVYRSAMAALVFGKSEYHIEVDGCYVPARRVVAGKQKFFSNFKLINACQFTPQLVDGLYVNVTGDRLEISSTDYLAAGNSYRVQDTLAIIWFVLLGCCGVNTLLCLIVLIRDAVKKRPRNRRSLWSGAYSLLLLLGGVGLLPSVPPLAVIVYAVVLTAASVAFIVLLARSGKEKQGVCFYLSWTLLLFFAVNMANIFIWDLAVL